MSPSTSLARISCAWRRWVCRRAKRLSIGRRWTCASNECRSPRTKETRMISRTVLISSLGWLLSFVIGTATARAEHANIKLELTAPDGRQEAYSDHEPPVGGV